MVLFVGLIVVPLVTVAVASTRLFQPGGRVLEVELQATGGRWAQIFWSADFAMSPDDSSLATLHQGPGTFDTLRFPLPQTPLEVLRLDPLDGEGEVVIRQMRVLDDQGQTVRTIDPMVMLPLHQIASSDAERDGVRFVTTPGANDPMLVTKSSWLVETPRWYSLQFVTPFSLAWIAMAVFVLIATGIGFILREIVAGPVSRRDASGSPPCSSRSSGPSWPSSSNIPCRCRSGISGMAKALTLYIPWADHGVTWRQMFTLHNEHRIFFSRLLALTRARHQRAVGSAPADRRERAPSLAGGARLRWRCCGWRWDGGICLAWCSRSALTLAPPFAIENSLAGFQSAFYFLVLFSGLALWLMGTSRPGTRRVVPRLSVCDVLPVHGCRWHPHPAGDCGNDRPSRHQPIGGDGELRGECCRPAGRRRCRVWCIAAAGLVPQALKAGSFRDFLIAFARSLAFPWINYPRATVLMWLPLAALG